MFKKLNKTQIIIFISIIIFIILLIFGIIFCINKFNKNYIKDTGIKMAEEITDITTNVESSSTEIKSKEITKEESTTINKETETETNKSQNIETSEVKTNVPTHPATVGPTQPQTEVKTKPMTQAQTSSQPVTQPQYYDPYTGQPISKEEYDSIMNEINNPEPTSTQAHQENVYVLNDDGTLNFKKSKINRPNSNEETEFLSLCKNSNPIKEIIGENLYPYITIFSYSWSSSSSYPTFYACINNEYWLVIGCYDNWNFKQGGDIVLCTNGLPVKNAW